MPALSRLPKLALATSAILVLALVSRVGLLERPPEFDELYHLLAARGWVETGRLSILDGEYTRTAWFTRAVAWLFAITGSASLETGRLLSVAAGVLVPPILFLWLRARAGWKAALIGAGLAILWPHGITDAQTLRFYSWQVLAFLVGAIAAFEAIERRGSERAGWIGLALVSLWIALYLQIATAIGIAAILVWVTTALFLPAVWAHPARWPILGALMLAGLAGLAALVWTGILAEAWALYRWSAGWAAQQQDNVAYYHFYLLRTYPVFWPLFPVAALLALRRLPRLTAYCCVIFGVILVAQSFGGMKSYRYLSYAMPFFFGILAIAGVEVLPAVTAAARNATAHLNPTRYRWITRGLIFSVAVFFVLANPFSEVALKAVVGKGRFGAPEADWTQIDDLIDEWEEIPFRMTMRELHTIDVLGDYDVLIAGSRLTEISDHSEFSVDPRTGRLVVGEPESVAAILRCEPEGVLLAERDWWEGEGWGVELLPLFEEAGRKVETRSSKQLFALRWSGGSSAPASCAALPL